MCLQQGGATLLSPSVRDAFFFICCFFSYLCCCWATGVSPLLELLLLLLFILAEVAKCVCTKEGRHSCRPAFAMHSFFCFFFSYLCCCWATGVSPLLELLLLLLFILAKVANCVCTKEGRHSCRPAFAMHSFFVSFLVTFVVVGRQECRPSLSCFYYCYSYYLRLPNVFATRRGDTLVAQRSRCILFLFLF